MNFGLKLLVTVRTDLEDVVAITTSGKNPFFKFLYCTGLNSDNVSAAKFRKSLSKYKSKLSFFIEKNIENSLILDPKSFQWYQWNCQVNKWEITLTGLTVTYKNTRLPGRYVAILTVNI